MCGRFSRKEDALALAARWAALPWPHEPWHDYGAGVGKPHYNRPPQAREPVVVETDRRRLAIMEWGIIPAWAHGRAVKPLVINARAETLAAKPAFKNLLPSRRCIVPATGFYEWKKEARGKQPYHFQIKGGGLFGFAGLWDSTGGGEDPNYRFTILTTAPNELVAPVHNRMPVILPPDAEARWLDPGERDPARLLDLLRPYPAGAMECWRLPSSKNQAHPAARNYIRNSGTAARRA